MVDSSIRFMVDSSIYFKVVPTKSIPLLTMIQLGNDAWEAKTGLHVRVIQPLEVLLEP